MRKLGQDVIDALEKAGKDFADSMGDRSKLQSRRLREIIEETRNRDEILAHQQRRPDRPDPHRAPDPSTPNADGLDAPEVNRGDPAEFGDADSSRYRDNYANDPDNVDAAANNVIHHAVEQQILRRYPDIDITPGQMHSSENLRGIPRDINGPLHLSGIRRMWNQFYNHYERLGVDPTPEQLLDYATLIDDALGDLFDPPIR
ncbi:hypothetical protein [Agrococcus sp. ARC_14]|uniref:hypothetical protein n=1 Tax=Agrococcus sp. ARC_14 TaxID=2919927 RepID=UPI001F05B49A|nr:hypothetical protein [Agrococcus sp. ARC_14]MCH1881564.1 hypothetical protein [Agrococcus sp. ARC_14]